MRAFCTFATIHIDADQKRAYARVCVLPLLFCVFVTNISLTLYLFSPNGVKVLIQFPNTLVALTRATCSFASWREKLLGGLLPSGTYRVSQYSIHKSRGRM